MATLTTNARGNQGDPGHAEEKRGTAAQLADNAPGSKKGKLKGVAVQKPRGDKIANKLVANKTANKKMDVKKGNQSNAERHAAVRARIVQKRGVRNPLPKRGAVKKDLAKAGVKKVIDTGKAFCCAPGHFDVDAFVDLPFPTRSETTATLWAKVEE